MKERIYSGHKEQPQACDNREIDLYDLINIEWPDSWSREDEFEESLPSPSKRFTNQEATRVGKTKFIVKIRLHNDRVYTVAEIPINQTADVEDQEAEIFSRFYAKLNKRHLHIQKPSHRVFRTSIIDELFITRI